MANVMFEQHQMEAAQMWLKVAEEKLELSSDVNTTELLDVTKEKVSFREIAKETREISENLCTKLKTTVHENNFKSSSISCRFVQEGGIPFSLRKFEDLSNEPKVYLIHDFFSKQEADQLKKAIEKIYISPIIVNITNVVTHEEEDDPHSELVRIFRQR